MCNYNLNTVDDMWNGYRVGDRVIYLGKSYRNMTHKRKYTVKSIHLKGRLILENEEGSYLSKNFRLIVFDPKRPLLF